MRDERLDVLRCGMNYLVIVLHAWAAFQYVPHDTVEYTAWTFVCSYVCWMAIPTFFLISGWLMFTNFSAATWPKKMIRRARRLFVPYVTWNVTFVIFYLSLFSIVPRLSKRVAAFGLDTFDGALSKILSLTVPPIDGPLWFLRTLLILSLAAPLFWFVIRLNRGILALFLCAFWIVAEWFCGWSDSMIMLLPSYAIFSFVLGGVVASNGRDLVATFHHWGWLVLGGGGLCRALDAL